MRLELSNILQTRIPLAIRGDRVIPAIMTVAEDYKSATVIAHSEILAMLVKCNSANQVFLEVALVLFYVAQTLDQTKLCSAKHRTASKTIWTH